MFGSYICVKGRKWKPAHVVILPGLFSLDYALSELAVFLVRRHPLTKIQSSLSCLF